MYADDAVIFVKPAGRDINNLALILKNFGEVTGLTTNLLKTSVTPISCEGMNLDDILGRAHQFPYKIPGATTHCKETAEI